MKRFKIEVDADMAKRFLSDFEKQITDKMRQRDEIASEIVKLEEGMKSLRSQIMEANGSSNRKPAGENKSRIIEYLKTVADKGARMRDIKKSTGIGISSINFTLNNDSATFVKSGKIWKLKT